MSSNRASGPRPGARPDLADPSRHAPFDDEGLRRRRVPLSIEVRLDFPGLEDFVREYSANISMGGMFIRTHHPQPVGTTFGFECRLADEFKVVHGTATVMWVRDEDEGPERPAGMGVRFDSLGGDSRQLIFHIVDRHIRKGGEPFTLNDQAS